MQCPRAYACDLWNFQQLSLREKKSFGPLGINSLTAHIYVYMHIHGYWLPMNFANGSLPIFPAINTFLYTLAFLPVCIALGVVRIKNYLQNIIFLHCM